MKLKKRLREIIAIVYWKKPCKNIPVLKKQMKWEQKERLNQWPWNAWVN